MESEIKTLLFYFLMTIKLQNGDYDIPFFNEIFDKKLLHSD